MKIYITPTDDFDKALAACDVGDTLELSEGEHYTKGNWYHRNWGYGINGVTIKGSLGGRSVVKLRNPVMQVAGVVRPQDDCNVLWLGANCAINDVDFDCSLPEYPHYHTGGLRFHGKFYVVNSAITGMRGNKAKGIEVFAISGQGDTGGSIVQKVTVKDVKPDSYVSGIYVGGTVPTATRSFVERCNVNLGGKNMFCYSANYETTFLDCRGDGAEAWFHNDFKDTTSCYIKDCSGSASEAAVRIIGTEAVLRQVVVDACNFKAKRGLELWQVDQPRMTGSVTFLHTKLDCQYAACCVSPHIAPTFIQCDITDGAECQYRSGTTPPSFILGEKPTLIKFVTT